MVLAPAPFDQGAGRDRFPETVAICNGAEGIILLAMRFIDLIQTSPLPTERSRAEGVFERLQKSPAADVVEAFRKDTAGGVFLEGVFDGSPFLGHAAATAPDALKALLEEGPDVVVDAAIAEIERAREAPTMQAAMAALRQARLRAAMAIAFADLAGAWPTMQSTAALSRVAEAAVDAALYWLLQDAVRRNVLDPEPGTPPTDGVIVLGMGKLGARELNYSSDVDLIFFYDAERIRLRRPDRMQHEMTRIARALAPFLEERTRDGYVYRTDLRLRPDPASTPPAVAVQAAEVYYESAGQNWERAAMIKARPIAGDIVSGEAFLERLRPFVWRRSLDFNAIRDIKSIKRQIDAKAGDAPPTAYDHNVKLGRGGIREVEFFAQTQQLIWGGREPELRSPETLAALQALRQAGQITADIEQDMAGSYLKLRDVEHRLQMVDDRQTHTTPDEADMYAFARFAGHETERAFVEELEGALKTVHRRYGELFADEPGLGADGPLSFTGVEEHPDTLKTIAKLGYENPGRINEIIRGWHHGRVRAARNLRARQILTEITPDLLSCFGDTAEPDRAFSALETFVARLPEGLQFFSLLEANRDLLKFLARILGHSAYLAELIGRRPHVIDAALNNDFMRAPGSKADYQDDLARETNDADDLQDRLDSARRWLNDVRLQLGVQTLEGVLRPDAAAAAMADAADVATSAMLEAARADFEVQHGRIEGSAYAVMAFGKWGSRELTIGSDLDLVAVYDAADGAQSDGRRPLPAPVYYMRLTQRLTTALTTSTGEGRLFNVDLRLRPSGDDGPVAVNVNAMRAYYEDAAWTWELMALTRARFAVGDPGLGEKLEAIRRDAILSAATRKDVLADVRAMHERVRAAKPAGGPWDVKQRTGGLLDVEFLAQGLTLAHGDAGDVSDARRPSAQFLRLENTGKLARDDANALRTASVFWLEAQWLLRLIGHSESIGAELAHRNARATFASVLGAPDYDGLCEMREAIARDVQTLFGQTFDGVAPADSGDQ